MDNGLTSIISILTAYSSVQLFHIRSFRYAIWIKQNRIIVQYYVHVGFVKYVYLRSPTENKY